MDSFGVRLFHRNKTVRLALALGLALSTANLPGWTDDLTPQSNGAIVPFSSTASPADSSSALHSSDGVPLRPAVNPGEETAQPAPTNTMEAPAERATVNPTDAAVERTPELRTEATPVERTGETESPALAPQRPGTTAAPSAPSPRRHWWQRNGNQPLTGNVDRSQLSGQSGLTSLDPNNGMSKQPRHGFLSGLVGRNDQSTSFNGTPQHGMLGGMLHPGLAGLAAVGAGTGLLTTLLHHNNKTNTGGLANVTTSGVTNNLVQDSSALTNHGGLGLLNGHGDSNHGGIGLLNGHGNSNHGGNGLLNVHGNSNHGLIGLVHGHGLSNNTGIVSALHHGSTGITGHGAGMLGVLQHGHGIAGVGHGIAGVGHGIAGVAPGLASGSHGLASGIMTHAHSISCAAVPMMHCATKVCGHSAISAAHVASIGSKAAAHHGRS